MAYLGYGIFSLFALVRNIKFITFENGKSEAGEDGAVVKATETMNLQSVRGSNQGSR